MNHNVFDFYRNVQHHKLHFPEGGLFTGTINDLQG